MHFDQILFIGTAIIGSYFGGKMCALLEKKVTGKVRFGMEFKTKRVISVLISIAGSYIATVEIMNRITGNVTPYPDLIWRIASVVVGVFIGSVCQLV
jgi:hypothetical protein